MRSTLSFKLFPVFIILLLCVLAFFILGNRSFTLGFLSALAILVPLQAPIKLRKKSILISATFIAISALILVFFVKADSSQGRLFIYKLSGQIWKDHFLQGVGYGRYGYALGEYQIAYFSSGNFNEAELLLADNAVHAYNDYFQLIIEQGAFGVGLAMLFLAILVFILIRSYKLYMNQPKLLPLLANSMLVTIVIAAFFSPVFEKAHWQGVFVISLSTAVYYLYNSNAKIFVVVTGMIVLIIVIIHYGDKIINRNSYKLYAEAFELDKAGFIRDANELYRQLYPAMGQKPAFLRDYITNNLKLKKYQESATLAEQLIEMENINLNYRLLADSYSGMGKLKESEDAYLKSVWRVPNRFVTRYALFNFYLKTDQLKKAKDTGLEIRNLPVKVPSPVVSQIRKAVFRKMSTMG